MSEKTPLVPSEVINISPENQKKFLDHLTRVEFMPLDRIAKSIERRRAHKARIADPDTVVVMSPFKLD